MKAEREMEVHLPFSLGDSRKRRSGNKHKDDEIETSGDSRRSNRSLAGLAASEPPGEILSEAKDLTHQKF